LLQSIYLNDDPIKRMNSFDLLISNLSSFGHCSAPQLSQFIAKFDFINSFAMILS